MVKGSDGADLRAEGNEELRWELGAADPAKRTAAFGPPVARAVP